MKARPAALLPLLLALAIPARAAQAVLTASATTVTVGERVELRVMARAGSAAARMIVAAGAERLCPGGACEVLARRSLPPAAAGDGFTFEEIVTVAFFRTGDFAVGPLAVEFRPPGSEEAGETGRLVIRVRSLLQEGDRDIQPLKEPLPLPGHPRHLLPFAAVLLALLLLAALALWLWRRRRRPAAAAAPPPAPEEELAAALQPLRRQGPPPGDPRPFFVALSSLIKRFCRRAYGFQAEDCTTAETAARLAEREQDAALVGALRAVLDGCDLVKFARRVPQATEVAALWPALDAVIESHRARRRAREAERAQAGR